MRTKFHYLKIKIKSLAAEARMIRAEERKVKRFKRNAKTIEHRKEHDATFWGLREHRTCDVRYEARAALLAYAYVRGIPYKVVEPKSNPKYIPWKRAAEIAQKYGYDTVKQADFEKWCGLTPDKKKGILEKVLSL